MGWLDVVLTSRQARRFSTTRRFKPYRQTPSLTLGSASDIVCGRSHPLISALYNPTARILNTTPTYRPLAPLCPFSSAQSADTALST